MESIYENGGFIGATLDFGTDEVYGLDRELDLSLTRTESASTFTAYSETERGQNTVFSCDITFPSPATDGQLFKMGGGVVGCWVGLRDSGTKFRVRAGDGGARSASSTNCALLDITDFPVDGNTHNVTWEFRVNPGRVRLWIDGVFKGESSTTGGAALRSSVWAGTNIGAYINVASDAGPSGEPATAWQGTNVGTGLRVFTNQLVTNDGDGNQKNSGIWSLQSVYDSLINPILLSEYIGSYGINGASTTYNFTIGSTGPGLAIISVHNEVNADTAISPTSVTIGGVSATQAIAANSDRSGSPTSTSIWYAVLTSSTTSVTVVHGSSPLRCLVGINLIQNYTSATPIFTGSSADGGVPTSRTINTDVIRKGAAIIAAYTAGDVYSTTWSGVIENYDGQIASSLTGASGGSSVVEQTETVTVTATSDSTPAQSTSLSVAVWG
jgi:hypothetical protein